MQNEQQYKIIVNGKTNIQVIIEALKFRDAEFNINVKYKKTAINFNKKYKIDLKNAPIVFVQNGIIWKLCYSTYISSVTGKVDEYAFYCPLASCKNSFKSLLRTDIKTL